MKLIVGLGNPGERYTKTRHNIGWRVVGLLIEHMELDRVKEDKKFEGLIAKNNNVILLKPLTFMNNSGQSVKLVSDYFKIEPSDIIIIHDDIDLSLGEIKIQKDRGAAGHKGVQSIINRLGAKDFKRIRIGIRTKETTDTEKFVLEKFTQEEEEIMKWVIKKATQEIIKQV
ncbi:MAG: aminoacyl-tRNA hydrolase [Candidatus Portnoybacteria bacterium]